MIMLGVKIFLWVAMGISVILGIVATVIAFGFMFFGDKMYDQEQTWHKH